MADVRNEQVDDDTNSSSTCSYLTLLDSLDKLYKTDPLFSKAIEESLLILEQAFERYIGEDLPPLLLSFNGGKDATVMFHIVRLAAARRVKKQGGKSFESSVEEFLQKHIELVYFKKDSNESSVFVEMEEFINSITKKHSLVLHQYIGGYKEGLQDLISSHGFQGVVMGVRRTDPSGKELDAFAPSSPGWPTFMRINPILDWSYQQVWQFLHGLGLPYCVLYDQGYTSLGCRSTTSPNPALKNGSGGFLPAYELQDSTLERAGRIAK